MCFSKSFGFLKIDLCASVTVVDDKFHVELQLGGFRRAVEIPVDAARVTFPLGSLKFSLEFRPDTTSGALRVAFLDGYAELPVLGRVRVFAVKLTLGQHLPDSKARRTMSAQAAIADDKLHPRGYFAVVEEAHVAHAEGGLREITLS
jgi:hypothetical protein